MLLNDYLCFCTGAQPVGGGVGAGWRGCCSDEAATRSSPVQVRFFLLIHYGDHYSTSTSLFSDWYNFLFMNWYIYYLGAGTCFYKGPVNILFRNCTYLNDQYKLLFFFWYVNIIVSGT